MWHLKAQSFIDLANSELEAYHQEAQLVRDKAGTQALKYNKLVFLQKWLIKLQKSQTMKFWAGKRGQTNKGH